MTIKKKAKQILRKQKLPILNHSFGEHTGIADIFAHVACDR